MSASSTLHLLRHFRQYYDLYMSWHVHNHVHHFTCINCAINMKPVDKLNCRHMLQTPHHQWIQSCVTHCRAGRCRSRTCRTWRRRARRAARARWRSSCSRSDQASPAAAQTQTPACPCATSAPPASARGRRDVSKHERIRHARTVWLVGFKQSVKFCKSAGWHVNTQMYYCTRVRCDNVKVMSKRCQK